MGIMCSCDVLTRPPLVVTRLPCGVHSAWIAYGTHGEMIRDCKWCASRPGKVRLAVGQLWRAAVHAGRLGKAWRAWAWPGSGRPLRGKGACKFQIRARHPGRVAPLRSACVSEMAVEPFCRGAGRPSGTPEYGEPERGPLRAQSPGEAQSCEANGLSPEVLPSHRRLQPFSSASSCTPHSCMLS